MKRRLALLVLLGIIGCVGFADGGSDAEPDEFVALERGVCYDRVYRMNPVIWDFDQLTEVRNDCYYELRDAIWAKDSIDEETKEDIWRALRGNRYTEYIQLAYGVEDGRYNIFADGTWGRCEYGCFPSVVYHGEQYTDVCVTAICHEGQTPNTESFCDPGIGDDVYYYFTTFYCQRVVKPSIICGPRAHCIRERPGWFNCEGDEVDDADRAGQGEIDFVVLAPENLNSPFMVAAYQNGQLLEEHPISSLSATEYVERFGPVRAADAYSYAMETGLARKCGLPDLADPVRDGIHVWPGANGDWGGSCRDSGSFSPLS